MLVVITTSNRKDKKYAAIIVEGGKTKILHFGASGYEDYTIHKNDLKRDKYEKRHAKNEDWEDYHKPAFWAKNLLWNKLTLEESAADIEDRYKIKVIFTDI